MKEFFLNNKALFDDTSNVTKPQKTEASPEKKDYTDAQIKHESNFRPSSGYFTRYNGLFNKVTYKEEGKPKQRPKTADKIFDKSEPFLSKNKVVNSRPCPSISTNKMNLMRCIR